MSNEAPRKGLNEHYDNVGLAGMVGPGWQPLVRLLRDEANRRDIEILEIKEKFGGLRFYYGPYDEIFDLMVTGAEAKAAHTCEQCGSTNGKISSKPGGYWLKCLCPDCRNPDLAASKQAPDVVETA